LKRYMSRVVHDEARLQEERRRRAGRRLFLETLEDRVVPSLLNLAPQAVRPDIASNVRTNLSYVQAGGDANPFHYQPIPLSLTLADGTRMNIGNGSSGRATRLDLLLKDDGSFGANVPGDDFAVTGKVTIGSQTYNGTLLTAEAVHFGFADSFTKASGEFD